MARTTALPILQVDAFSDRPFGGNPAAVCVLQEPKPESWMRHLAAEMNLSETAFVIHQEDGYHLRWFTPTVEVDLCGHATLATAHVLWTEGYLAINQPAEFITRSGKLTARFEGDWIELDFPLAATQAATAPAGLAEALGCEIGLVERSAVLGYWLVALESEAAVRQLKPLFTRLGGAIADSVIVTAPSESDSYDFVSRFFAPAMGIDEDPVTGSAHCCLGPYWSQRLNKLELVGYQASKRGGLVKLKLDGSDRIQLAGKAITVLKGELNAAAYLLD
ncbi:MAG: PhzF family phenazine biosynthesis protein [Synechococcales cyanobacterium RM1_1_8]|nr:PhzF family phenazine biosynthesis protein [Synechococcales cyanobacterium RM1_1_8]